MRSLAAILIAAGIACASTGSPAFAQAMKIPEGEPCSQGFISPGIRATADDIAKARNADVQRVDQCEKGYASQFFSGPGQIAAIQNNKVLTLNLRTQSVLPYRVIGVEIRRGELIVYVPR